jgi:hypothetical protein
VGDITTEVESRVAPAAAVTTLTNSVTVVVDSIPGIAALLSFL